MKPDKLDIKIQDAAAQNEPAYNEQAWSSMEKLLDKEMPQKKKEKRKRREEKRKRKIVEEKEKDR